MTHRNALGGPATDLLLAYRGTAYFLRWLSLLPESSYGETGHPLAPTDRRTTIATVGYDARGWATLAEGLRERRPAPATFQSGEREAAILQGATLPPRALRHLVEHSAVHLAVEWRDLPAAEWSGHGVDENGALLPADCTPWLRARQVWLAAVDLGNGGTFSDFPSALIERLIVNEGATIVRENDDEYRVEWNGSVLAGPLSRVAQSILRGSTSAQRLLAPAVL